MEPPNSSRPKPPPSTDPAGTDEERLARADRANAARQAKLEAMSPHDRMLNERLMATMGQTFGDKAAGNKAPPPYDTDPFAPLPDGEGVEPPKPDDDIWEPQTPTLEPVSAPDGLRWPGYGPGTAQWVYRDAEGQVLHIVNRFECTRDDGTIDKQTIAYAFGRRVWTTTSTKKRKDQTKWHPKALPAPRPLYGLDRLAQRPDVTVLVVEGEKAADAATALFPGLVATCSSGGAKAAGKADWSPLQGRRVVIWPDHDKAGLGYAKAVKDLLLTIAEVGVVDVPKPWPDGWDVADAAPEGVTVETLAEMISAAEQIASEPEQQQSDRRQSEIERYSKMPRADYAVVRKEAAASLGMGVTGLDKLIKAEKAKRAAERAAKDRNRPPPAPGFVQWPSGFKMEADGLYCETTSDDAPEVWICPPFQVLGEGRDAQGEGWGLWLQWQDRDHRVHRWAMPKRLLMVGPGEMEAEMVDRGLGVAANAASRALLRQALGGVQSGTRVITVDRPGWHTPLAGPAAYVMQDGSVIGEANEAIVLRSMAEGAPAMLASVGSLQGWQENVAQLAEGNDIAAFCISFGFAGPMMEIAGEASGGFHIFGRSKVGKTLVASLAVTVWGTPRKGHILRDWRSTSNGMELAAAESNDCLLVLDEIHQVEPRELLSVVYMLANEAGKARARRDITSARKKTWRVPILSTGEVDVASMAAKANQPLTAGAQVRLPSLPVDAVSMWPHLHGRADARALMAELHAATRKYYGTAGRAFLAKLTAARRDEADDLADASEAMRERFAKVLPASADQQVFDVARRCALIAFAGEMAIDWGILPWPEDTAAKACLAVLQLWLGKRGGGGSSEDAQHVRLIRLFLVTHGAARFVRIHQSVDDGNKWWVTNPERQVQHRAGWIHATADGRDEYLIDPDVWKEVCTASGADPIEAARTLHKAGFLVSKDGKNLTTLRTVPGMGRPRVYVITPDLLGQKEA